jgi:tetratricopeptide (TPR) repeat protein
MSAVYPFPEPGKLSVLFYISPVVITGLAILILYSLKYTRVIAFGTVFFLFNIMFLLQVVSAGQGFIADRFGYIAFIGLFFIYAWGFQRLEEKKAKWRPSLRTAAIMLLLIYAGLSRNQVYAWQNSETLWTDVLSKYENATQAYVNRGKYYRELKQNDKALEDFNACIRVNPDDYNGYNSRGRLYFDLGETDKAIPDFNRAIELNPGSAKTYSNRGAAYGKKKVYASAVSDLNKAIQLDPGEYEAYLNRAIVNFYTQKYPESAADCKTYLNYKPNESSVWDLAALCYKNMNDYDMALVNSNQAIRLNPSNGAFYLNRSYIHFYLGNKEKARSDIERAINSGIKPDPAFLDQLSLK